MSVTLRELVGSRKVSSGVTDKSITLEFIAMGSVDEDDIHAAVLAGTPTKWGRIYRQKIDLDHKGGGVWMASVEYSTGQVAERHASDSKDPPDKGEFIGDESTVSISGQTQHITQSRETVYAVARGTPITTRNFGDGVFTEGSKNLGSPASAANFTQADVGATIIAAQVPDGTYITAVTDAQNAVMNQAATATASDVLVSIGKRYTESYGGVIGVSKDGVQGCDIHAPKMEFSITINVIGLKWADLNTLATLAGTVNLTGFCGFDTGEVLFLGAELAGSDEKPAKVTCKFAVSRNRKNIDLISPDSDGVVQFRIPEKRGWDYLWVAYEDAIGGSSLITRPKAAYVERVYEYLDWNQLASWLG